MGRCAARGSTRRTGAPAVRPDAGSASARRRLHTAVGSAISPPDAQPCPVGSVWTVLVTALTIDRRHGRRALLLAAGAALLALCATVVIAGTGADPASAARAKTIGKTKKTPRPSCPKDPCEAVGSVTGFQTHASGTK